MLEDNDKLFLNAEQQADIQGGVKFLKNFFSLVRSANYHSANNVALLEPSLALEKSVAWFVERESSKNASFVCGNNGAFAGSLRIRVGRRDLILVEELFEFLTLRKIGGITFLHPMNAEQLRLFAGTLVHFTPDEELESGVESLTQEFAKARLDTYVEPVEPMVIDARGGWGGFNAKTELGNLVAAFAKGYALLCMMQEHDSPALENALKAFLREIIGIEGDMLAKMIGIVSLANAQDMAMRSLTSLLVTIAIADRFGASREIMLEMGHICVEQCRWDLGVVKQQKVYGAAMAGATALGGINRHKSWSLDVIRRFITVAGRYSPPESVGAPPGIPTATRVSEILRIATDWVDLTVPTPLKDSERLFENTPVAPHMALFRMYDEVEARYSPDIFAALVQGVGLLPLGTAVETADGAGCIIYERTGDPLTYIAKDAITEKQREAAFVEGPNEIVTIVTGADLLEVRSRMLIGEDFDNLQMSAEEAEAAAREWQ